MEYSSVSSTPTAAVPSCLSLLLFKAHFLRDSTANLTRGQLLRVRAEKDASRTGFYKKILAAAFFVVLH